MAEEQQASEAVVDHAVIEAGPVRPLPVRRAPGTIELWGMEVGPVAIAATAGAAAGVVAIAAARSRTERRPPRRGLFRRREKIVAGRSFLVDVHILGR